MKKIIALIWFAASFSSLIADNGTLKSTDSQKNDASKATTKTQKIADTPSTSGTVKPVTVQKTDVQKSAKKEEAFQDPTYLQDLLSKTRKTATTASVQNITSIQTLLAESSRGMMYSLQTDRIDLLTRFIIYTINSTALAITYLQQYVDQNAKKFKFATQTKAQFLSTMNNFSVRLTTLQRQLNDLVYNKANHPAIRSAIDRLDRLVPSYGLVIAYNQIMHESGDYTAIDNVMQNSTAPHDIKYLSELIAGLLSDITQRIPVYLQAHQQ